MSNRDATLHQVAGDLSEVFAGLTGKAAWYSALGSIPDFTDLPSLDAENSLSVWRWVLAEAGEPLGPLLAGDANSFDDPIGNDDPHVGYFSPERVGAVANALVETDADQVADLLAAGGFAPHRWLHGPLTEFFAAAERIRCGVIVIGNW